MREGNVPQKKKTRYISDSYSILFLGLVWVLLGEQVVNKKSKDRKPLSGNYIKLSSCLGLKFSRLTRWQTKYYLPRTPFPWLFLNRISFKGGSQIESWKGG